MKRRVIAAVTGAVAASLSAGPALAATGQTAGHQPPHRAAKQAHRTGKGTKAKPVQAPISAANVIPLCGPSSGGPASGTVSLSDVRTRAGYALNGVLTLTSATPGTYQITIGTAADSACQANQTATIVVGSDGKGRAPIHLAGAAPGSYFIYLADQSLLAPNLASPAVNV